MISEAQVLRRVRDVLRRQHKAWRTEQCYCGWISRFYRFALKLPRGMSPERKMEAFVTMLAREREVSATTQNQAFNAIVFLNEKVWGRKLGDVSGLRAKQSTFARHCPTREEVVAVLKHVEETPAIPGRLVLATLYGCGLRVNEGLDLRLKDVRLNDRHFVIRAPKHGRDRWAKIPDFLVPAIRAQMAYARRIFELDQARTPPLPLQIPGALARKYKRSPFTLGWMFLFPAPAPLREPRTRRKVRWHLPDWRVQRLCKAASERAGLIAAVTPHCLRHAFATHFNGDIRDLQELLGHKSLETTATYRHPALARARSPLDDMAESGVQLQPMGGLRPVA